MRILRSAQSRSNNTGMQGDKTTHSLQVKRRRTRSLQRGIPGLERKDMSPRKSLIRWHGDTGTRGVQTTS